MFDKDERPKGISGLPRAVAGRASIGQGSTEVPMVATEALMMIGRQASVSAIFVPSSTSSEYQLSIRRFSR